MIAHSYFEENIVMIRVMRIFGNPQEKKDLPAALVSRSWHQEVSCAT